MDNTIAGQSDCPCCSGEKFSQCCEPIVAGTAFAATPLALMRSRYTAHVCKNMDHILRTMRGKPLTLFDAEKTKEEWFELCQWKKLEIIDAPAVGKTEKSGIVEFKAYYDFEDKEYILHERSKFLKTNNQWYYVSGQKKSADIRTSTKIGRNDDCQCGSGKKYKKCCANVEM
jgi:SEC-C motif-containing protein